MREAVPLGLTPEQLAKRHEEEAAKLAAAEKVRKEAEAVIKACREDWARCVDNAAMANNYY
jgi:hypothetical protein